MRWVSSPAVSEGVPVPGDPLGAQGTSREDTSRPLSLSPVPKQKGTPIRGRRLIVVDLTYPIPYLHPAWRRLAYALGHRPTVRDVNRHGMYVGAHARGPRRRSVTGNTSEGKTE